MSSSFPKIVLQKDNLTQIIIIFLKCYLVLPVEKAKNFL